MSFLKDFDLDRYLSTHEQSVYYFTNFGYSAISKDEDDRKTLSAYSHNFDVVVRKIDDKFRLYIVNTGERPKEMPMISAYDVDKNLIQLLQKLKELKLSFASDPLDQFNKIITKFQTFITENDDLIFNFSEQRVENCRFLQPLNAIQIMLNIVSLGDKNPIELREQVKWELLKGSSSGYDYL